MGLVDYDSTSDDESQSAKRPRSLCPESTSADRIPKRRKALPAVPSTYLVDPRDDPSKHQGRTRSRPFVPGELNAHVYLNLKISTSLRRALDELVAVAQTKLPGYTLHSLLATPTPSQKAGELHVSLTHPLPLRASQVEPFRAELSDNLRRWSRSTALSSFKCSLAGRLSVYYNGKATGGEGAGGRAFMALRLGAGAREVSSMVDKAIHPLLAKYHLPLYHTNPEFHASFAWCLLRPGEEGITSGLDTAMENDGVEDHIARPAMADSPFTRQVLDDLNTGFERKLLEAQPRGGWDVSHAILRVGKAVHNIGLA